MKHEWKAILSYYGEGANRQAMLHGYEPCTYCGKRPPLIGEPFYDLCPRASSSEEPE